MAVLVVGASSLLASYPVTPVRLGADEATGRAASSPALPTDGSLSLASYAGETLVALTLRPGRPGPNAVYLDLIPIVGPAAADRLSPSLTIDGRPSRIGRCGVSCRTSSADLRGGEHLEVRLPGVSEVAAFDLPALPVADASGLVTRMERRMAALRTYRIDEVLRPGPVPLHTTYWFQAPDRLRFDIATGAQAIIVGDTRYDRSSPADGWQREPAVPVRVPTYPWESGEVIGAHVLGPDSSRGPDVSVVAFFEDAAQQPVWYRLWVDPSGLVLRVEMRTPGHFMDDDYLEPDAPLTIQTPVKSEARR